MLSLVPPGGYGYSSSCHPAHTTWVLEFPPLAPFLSSLTSSLKGKGGMVGSNRNKSSHSRAFRHNARLSTSRAMGPTESCTVGKGRKRCHLACNEP